ncbi:penicillin-binding protein activator LpoB [Treponema sp.]|uniref:penicillin-binding protein activator LpoB n=1 Tax=Treponema sp. TaxID=166 RepID=UPI00388E13F4
MRKNILLSIVLLSICSALCFSAKVKRVDSDKLTDLDGFWNDNDVKIVCDSLIEQCVNSPAVRKKSAKIESITGEMPYAIIGKIENNSSEHIDTSIIETKFRNAIINSGVMNFVASKNERDYLREEKDDQQETTVNAKSLGNETAADYMLIGTVKSIVQKEGKKSVRAYFVDVQLVDIETNRILWTGEDDSIKKVVKRSKVKL